MERTRLKDRLKGREMSQNVYDLRPPKAPDATVRGPDMTIDEFITDVENKTKDWQQTPEYKQWYGRMESWALANYLGSYRSLMNTVTNAPSNPPSDVNEWRQRSKARADRLSEIINKKTPPSRSQFDDRFDPR